MIIWSQLEHLWSYAHLTKVDLRLSKRWNNWESNTKLHLIFLHQWADEQKINNINRILYSIKLPPLMFWIKVSKKFSPQIKDISTSDIVYIVLVNLTHILFYFVLQLITKYRFLTGQSELEFLTRVTRTCKSDMNLQTVLFEVQWSLNFLTNVYSLSYIYIG